MSIAITRWVHCQHFCFSCHRFLKRGIFLIFMYSEWAVFVGRSTEEETPSKIWVSLRSSAVTLLRSTHATINLWNIRVTLICMETMLLLMMTVSACNSSSSSSKGSSTKRRNSSSELFVNPGKSKTGSSHARVKLRERSNSRNLSEWNIMEFEDVVPCDI